MRITQGQFSYLPELTDEEISVQVQYALDREWPLSIEYTDDPHFRNTYWEMHDLPMFDLKDAAGVVKEINEARKQHPEMYIRVNAYDATLERQTVAMSYIVQRPSEEPGFRLERQETSNRRIRYTTHAYVTDVPTGQWYKQNQQ